MMTVLWILLAVAIAALVALYQYGFIFSRNEKKKSWLFALLRFATILSLLLLLLLPKFKSVEYQTVLPRLVVLADNSKSINHLNVSEDLGKDFQTLMNENSLNEKFNISSFGFDNAIESVDTLSFSGNSSDIESAISKVQKLFKNERKAVVILTDGVQNQGRNYKYSKIDGSTSVYPVIYGDTTRYPDVSIKQININRYSYLNNEFPVEVILSYNGNSPVTSQFKILENSKTLYSATVNFDKENSSQILKFDLKSTQVGLKSMTAVLTPIPSEKNKSNNTKPLLVEVIDQQTKVLIESAVMHPDLGALKKAIESNQQRSVDIKTVDENIDYSDYNLIVFYGVDSSFKKRMDAVQSLSKNLWVILGKNPQLDLFNASFDGVAIETDIETDEVQPLINGNYSSFNVDTFNYEDFPPVSVPYGSWNTSVPVDVLMYKKIAGIDTDTPIWFTFEDGGKRFAVSSFNGLWRWRAHAFLENKEFSTFDDLVSAQVQYLADRKTRNRLTVDALPIYENSNNIFISASYLDKNYEFEKDGVLNLQLNKIETDSSFTRPFTVNGNKYQVDLSGINSGDYQYNVVVKNSNLKRSGFFKVLEYDPELLSDHASSQEFQFLLGKESVFYQEELSSLIDKIKKDEISKPIERERFSFNALIDYKYLLAALFVLLGLEWFLRKYNGLI